MNQPLITVATSADRAAAVATFVAAFEADPAVRYFLPDDATYPARAATMAGELFDSRVGLGSIWLADAGAALAMWDPPRPHRASAGAADGGAAGGAPRGGRHDGRFGRYQAIVHRALPQFPHWYLGVLAAHPQLFLVDHAGLPLKTVLETAGHPRRGGRAGAAQGVRDRPPGPRAGRAHA